MNSTTITIGHTHWLPFGIVWIFVGLIALGILISIIVSFMPKNNDEERNDDKKEDDERIELRDGFKAIAGTIITVGIIGTIVFGLISSFHSDDKGDHRYEVNWDQTKQILKDHYNVNTIANESAFADDNKAHPLDIADHQMYVDDLTINDKTYTNCIADFINVKEPDFQWFHHQDVTADMTVTCDGESKKTKQPIVLKPTK